MSKEFLNKTAVLTGAGSGISAALCKAFSEEGANIAALDIDLEAAENTIRQIRNTGGTGSAYRVNVADFQMVNDVCDKIIKDFKTVDIWVNCAGISYIIPFLECTEEIWD